MTDQFAWPGDLLGTEISRLQKQRSETYSRLNDALDRARKIETELALIDSALAALRATNGGAK